MQYVEKYKDKTAFVCLSDLDKHNLVQYLAPLVYQSDVDEVAKGFDNLMYGMMLAKIEGLPQFQKAKGQLITICVNLTRRMTIPQVKQKSELIQTIPTDEFWEDADILTFEAVRIALRELIKFMVDAGSRSLIYTNLIDSILSVQEGELLEPAYDFEDYRLKVNRYVEENKENIAIYKLRNNIPLTAVDYESLEQILTGKLGTKSDYERVFGATPFGLLVRKIAKLEYDAAMRTFSEFINDQSLQQTQIVFVKKIVDYIVQNGYVENMVELTKPPFDKPISFMKLFDKSKQERIIALVSEVKENAIKVVG